MNKLILISFMTLLFTTSASAYVPLYDVGDPTNLGSVPATHDGAGIPSTMTRWKSSRVQATQSGTATHFIIRVGSANVGSVPVGFAVYAGTAGEQDPIGALLIRGYHAAHNFTGVGYYALPFTSAESMEVVAGNQNHLKGVGVMQRIRARPLCQRCSCWGFCC